MIHRILSMLRLGRVTIVDDSGPVRRLQIEEGDYPGGKRVIDKVPHVQEFGFASVPPIGSEVMLAAPCGDRSQTVAVGTNHQPSRLRDQQPGDSGIYDVRGAKVQLTAAGLLIDCAGLPAVIQNASTVTIDAPMVHVTGDLKVDGTLTGDGITIELGALRDAYNAHHHTGVKAGSDTSGTTDHAV